MEKEFGKLTKEELVEVLKEKSAKHRSKCRQHEESKEVLEKAHQEQVASKDYFRSSSTLQKIISTEKNIEYHQGSYKTYEKILNMIS